MTDPVYVPGTYYIDSSRIPSTVATGMNPAASNYGWNFYGYHPSK